MLEMVAITFDGAHAAERSLSELRATRDDPWLSEVSIIEHDTDGRYSVKAKNPDVEDRHAGKGAAIGGLTGLFIGAIGGPFGLVLWSGTGALAGGAIGAGKESAFLPMVEDLKARVAPGASMLVLVGVKPMKVFAPLGLSCLALATGVFVWELAIWLAGDAIKPVRSVNFVLGMGLFGLQTLFFGLLAELIVRRNRPQ